MLSTAPGEKSISRREFVHEAGIGTVLSPIVLSGWSAKQKPEKTWRIGIFSKHLQWLGYREMADAAARIGFDHVDLTVRPGGHVLPERVEEDLPRAVEAVKKAGLEALTITTEITGASKPHTEKILKTASKLGIRYYRMGSLNFDEKKGVEESLKAFEPDWKELAAMNEQYRIKGDYQNHAGKRVGAPLWDLWLLLKSVNSPWLGCQFDVRHATAEGPSTWPLGLRLLRPYIHTMDIKDFHWEKRDDGKWVMQHVPMGTGMVDWKTFMGLVTELDLHVPLCMHFEYELGGADKGASKLEIDPAIVLDSMKKDLDFLKGILP